MTKQFALELAVRGIRVNAVAPGPVERRWRKRYIRPSSEPTIVTPSRSAATGLEQELAEAIFFLCSERASYITGHTLAVDGGFDAIGIGLPTFRRETPDT